MKEMKELNDNELESVTGGTKAVLFPGNLSNYSEYSESISKYAGEINTKYLFKKDNSHWVFGTLVNTYEQGWIRTVRTHDILVEDCKGLEIETDHDLTRIGKTWVNNSGTREVNGDEYIIYKKV